MSVRKSRMQMYKNMFTEYPDVVGIKEISKMLGIGRDKAYKLVRNGELQKLSYTGSIKVPKIIVIEYLLRCIK